MTKNKFFGFRNVFSPLLKTTVKNYTCYLLFVKIKVTNN